MSVCVLRVPYRGVVFGPDELAWLQRVIDSEKNAQAAAKRVCEHFGWLRPNGTPPLSSCSVFLRHLSNRSLIRLPPRKRAASPRLLWCKERERLLRELGPVPGMVECQPSGPLTVRPIAPEEWDGFRLHMRCYHYLGFEKPVGESICYVALLGNEVVALLVWGAAVMHNGPRDRHLGWDAATRERRLIYVINNRRYLILPWVRLPHLASRVLAANLRRVNRDWVTAYGHPVVLAETFIDSARFSGICYRASNWLYLGETRGFSRTPQRGFAPNNTPKSCFIYPLHRQATQVLRGERPLPSRLVRPCSRP